jgi:hypothetical protein
LRALTIPLLPLLLLATLLAPAASAGTLEAPEITDPEGDCAFTPGNEYMDIVAVWISDETAMDFNVNIAIPKWNDAAGVAAGFTVQFTHQGVQFGVVAASQGAQGWYYGNAVVDENGVSEMTDASGSFTPGSPNVLTVQFHKSNFPHGDAADDKLVSIWAGSVDLKPSLPFLVTGTEPPIGFTESAIDCDDAESNAVYTFAVGDHSAHASGGSGDADDATGEGSEGAASESAPPDDAALKPQSAPEAETPGVGLVAVLAVVAGLAFARRRPS